MPISRRPLISRKPLGGVLQQLVLVGRDVRQPEPVDVIERGAQSDGVGDVRRAGLELGRELGERRLFERHVADHVAAALPRRHDLQQFFLGVNGADAGGAENLVPGEDEEVAAELLHVDRDVGDRLRAVDQHAGAVALGHLGHLGHRQDRAQAVRGVRQRDELGARAEDCLILLEHDFAPVVDGNDPQDGPLFLGDHLPGDDVGVMLERREDDLVARLQEFPAVGLGDEIDPFGGAADEDDFLRRRGAEKRLHLLPGLLEGVGRTGRQRVRAAVDVRVVVRVEMRDGVDHALRLLRRGGIVEPGQRLAMHLLLQDGKILANGRHVQRPRCRRRSGLAGRQSLAQIRPGRVDALIATRKVRLPDSGDKPLQPGRRSGTDRWRTGKSRQRRKVGGSRRAQRRQAGRRGRMRPRTDRDRNASQMCRNARRRGGHFGQRGAGRRDVWRSGLGHGRTVCLRQLRCRAATPSARSDQE